MAYHQRRKGDKWYIGGLTSHKELTVTIDLSQIGDRFCTIELYRDGVNAHRHADDYKKTVSVAENTLTVNMAPGGGFAAIVY